MRSLGLDRRILQSWSVFLCFLSCWKHLTPAQERLAQRGEKSELKWLGLLGTRFRPERLSNVKMTSFSNAELKMSYSWLPTSTTPQEGSDSGLLAVSCRALIPILPPDADAAQTTLLKPTIRVHNHLPLKTTMRELNPGVSSASCGGR